MNRMYVERKDEIEGETVTLSLFVGSKAENEGIDVCATDIQEKLLNILDEKPVWKVIKWNQETMNKKDGSGTYQKNVKTTYSPEEYAEIVKARKKAEKTQSAK